MIFAGTLWVSTPAVVIGLVEERSKLQSRSFAAPTDPPEEGAMRAATGSLLPILLPK